MKPCSGGRPRTGGFVRRDDLRHRYHSSDFLRLVVELDISLSVSGKPDGALIVFPINRPSSDAFAGTQVPAYSRSGPTALQKVSCGGC